jgi:hypothetical protein
MIFILVLLLLSINDSSCFLLNNGCNNYVSRSALKMSTPSSKLLPDPTPNSIGNFFDNSTDSVSFIQCWSQQHSLFYLIQIKFHFKNRFIIPCLNPRITLFRN